MNRTTKITTIESRIAALYAEQFNRRLDIEMALTPEEAKRMTGLLNECTLRIAKLEKYLETV